MCGRVGKVGDAGKNDRTREVFILDHRGGEKYLMPGLVPFHACRSRGFRDKLVSRPPTVVKCLLYGEFQGDMRCFLNAPPLNIAPSGRKKWTVR